MLFFNRNRPLNQTIRLAELEERDRYPTLPSLTRLQTLLFTFTELWMCPVQKEVDLVEVSIFYKSEKANGQIVRPITINIVALFYLIMAT